jgi:hypothetical protein
MEKNFYNVDKNKLTHLNNLNHVVRVSDMSRIQSGMVFEY